jgi:hypothetical protein
MWKNVVLFSEYGYYGDGKKVWAKDYESYLPKKPKLTFYVGNYYDVQIEGYKLSSRGNSGLACNQSYCVCLPFLARSVVENLSYYYPDA